MKIKTAYIGLDVDNPQHYGALLNKAICELANFKWKPTKKDLLG